MSNSWYQRHVGTRGPVTPAVPDPTRFIIGPDGRAYAIAPESAPPEAISPSQQYPAQPWNQGVLPGQAPLGQSRASDALLYWKGRDGARADSGRCPNCGSTNYFPTMRAESDTGGESGKISAGHCAGCGFRDIQGRQDGLRGPTLQVSTRGIRPLGAGEIPIEQARSVTNGNQDAWGRPSGTFAIVEKVLVN